jgi:hypothetical protein
MIEIYPHSLHFHRNARSSSSSWSPRCKSTFEVMGAETTQASSTTSAIVNTIPHRSHRPVIEKRIAARAVPPIPRAPRAATLTERFANARQASVANAVVRVSDPSRRVWISAVSNFKNAISFSVRTTTLTVPQLYSFDRGFHSRAPSPAAQDAYFTGDRYYSFISAG